MKIPLELAGTSLALGIAGKAFDSQGLYKASAATSKFIAPAVNISVGGSLIRQVKSFGRKYEKDRKKSG